MTGAAPGIGSGLAIRFGGAIDGIEVLAVIFAKRIGITVGVFVMLCNVALSAESGYGIARIDVRGYYSGEEKCVVHFVVNRF